MADDLVILAQIGCAHRRDGYFANLIVGDRSLDIYLVKGWVSGFEWYWAKTHIARFLLSLLHFRKARQLTFRGTGYSCQIRGSMLR